MTSIGTELVALGSVPVNVEDMAQAWREPSAVIPLELAPALDARIAALRAWADETGSEVSGPALEAAATARLIRGAGGPCFERQAFDDMVEFLHHLPW